MKKTEPLTQCLTSHLSKPPECGSTGGGCGLRLRQTEPYRLGLSGRGCPKPSEGGSSARSWSSCGSKATEKVTRGQLRSAEVGRERTLPNCWSHCCSRCRGRSSSSKSEAWRCRCFGWRSSERKSSGPSGRSCAGSERECHLWAGVSPSVSI